MILGSMETLLDCAVKMKSLVFTTTAVQSVSVLAVLDNYCAVVLLLLQRDLELMDMSNIQLT